MNFNSVDAKEKLPYFKNIILTVIFMLPVVITMVMYFQFTNHTAQRQSYSILDNDREQIMLILEAQSKLEKEKMDTASNFLSDVLSREEIDINLATGIMRASSIDRAYTHWELMLPDGSAYHADGTTFELPEGERFEDKKTEGFRISERKDSTDNDGNSIILLTNSIYKDDVCVGILISVIDLDELYKTFVGEIEQSIGYVIVYDKNNGDILLDTLNKSLGNVSDYATDSFGVFLNEEVTGSNIANSKSGHGVYRDKKLDKKIYVSYATADFADWELVLLVDEDICMESSKIFQYSTLIVFLILSVWFIIYLFVAVKELSKRHKSDSLRAAELGSMLERVKNANDEKSEFLAKMSSELHEPLNGIIGLLEVAERHPDDTELLRENRVKVGEAVKKLIGLTQNVSAVSKREQAPERYKTLAERQKAALDGISILVAEDNELNAEVAKAILEEQGAIVKIAVNGQDAVDTFKRSRRGTFDIIMMDMNMPVMDGLSATRRIRAMDREDAKTIPIFSVTASSNDDAQTCFNAGINEHLTKPVDIKVTIDLINKYVVRKP